MIGLTFGRFRIIHAGHLEMFRQMLAENDEIIIGISNSSEVCRPQEVLETLLGDDFNRVSIVYFNNPFSFMRDFEELNGQISVNFYAGADRANMLARLSQYHPNIVHRVVQRIDSSPSSTRCRQCIKGGFNTQDLVLAGLANNTQHALLIIAQYHLELLVTL